MPGQGSVARRGDLPQESRGDLWWKEAVVYTLDVETFADGNGDGIGDFDGLMSRLGYLSALGVDCLWLLPFYPSPNRDDGYDVVDFYAVDERFGTLGDFTEFVHHAGMRGIRVLLDLVVNHTSDEHPWFEHARSSRDSPYREYYIWADEPFPIGSDPAFPGESDELWTYDDEAGQYYLHRFHPFQPELNITSAAVRREIRRIMSFWLQLGVSGFRIDAVNHLLDMSPIRTEHADDPHRYLEDIRRFIGRRAGNVALLGEADVSLHDLPAYFGTEGREELDMLFDFQQPQRIFLSMASGSADPVRSHLDTQPPTSPAGQWVTFLRNHDELNLDGLPQHQRDLVLEAFGGGEDAEIYARGLRRRLAPMLGGDPRRLRFLLSLLFSLPGTPQLLYGDEIGIGDNLELDGRYAVRVPMQWADGSSAGFSTAPPEDLVRPVAMPPFGPDQVNVAVQRVDPDSLLNWVSRAIRTRKESPELAWGRFSTVDVGHSDILVHRCELQGRVLVFLHCFGTESRCVDLGTVGDGLVAEGDLLSDRPYADCDLHSLEIEGLGYRWIATIEREPPPEAEEEDGERSPNPRQADEQEVSDDGG
jgi:trehalose synthase